MTFDIPNCRILLSITTYYSFQPWLSGMTMGQLLPRLKPHYALVYSVQQPQTSEKTLQHLCPSAGEASASRTRKMLQKFQCSCNAMQRGCHLCFPSHKLDAKVYLRQRTLGSLQALPEIWQMIAAPFIEATRYNRFLQALYNLLGFWVLKSNHFVESYDKYEQITR